MAKKGWEKDVRESAQRIWLAGLGALARAEEEGSKLFSTLVHEGERIESKGKVQWDEVRREVELAASRARRGAAGALGALEETFDEQVSRTLHRVGVPTRDEIAALGRRVEELTNAVERLRVRNSPGAAQAAGGGAAKTGAAKTGTAKTGAANRGAGKTGAVKRGATQAAAPGSGARTRPAKGAPLPKKITTTDDVTTTADVRTPPK